LYDEGFLRDVNTLPVSELRFGDVNSNSGERGNFTLGSLRCKWTPDAVVPSCKALADAGVRKTGNYRINMKDGVKVEPYEVKCDFTGATGFSTEIQQANKFEFTSCGKTGRFGPTFEECAQYYRDKNVKVGVKNGTQLWQCKRAGVYKITAYGPSGYTPNKLSPGKGAVVSARFEIPADTEIRMLVGQKGYKHSGSGGTFVVMMFEKYTKNLLLVAGAGGSSNSPIPNLGVTDASRSKKGKDGSTTGTNFGKGGDNGQGGEMGGANSGPNTSGGGAGYHGNGIASSDQRFTPKPSSAMKYLTHTREGEAPGLGGSYTYNMNNVRTVYEGGFGGGGSGAKEAPGGAGGYSGGGGGPSQGYSGGGGTYWSPEHAEDAKIQISNQGEGKVVVEWISDLKEVEASER